jgi:hypothetical protein
MSRTYRHKKGVPTSWYFEDPTDFWVRIKYKQKIDPAWVVKEKIDYGYPHLYRWVDPDSKEGRCISGKPHRDKVVRFKEPGPHWYRNLFTDRPLRREAKRELQKFMHNPEHEPIIGASAHHYKGKLEYWT